MHDLRTQQKLKWWPSLQDYNEAIQTPMASLQDAELKMGMPYTSALGLPRPISGAFASVYRMHCDKKDYALRLFLRNIENQSERYARISKFVQQDNLPYTVTFDFLANGIKTRGDWFPALKMEWVEGIPFEEYIIDNLNNPQKLAELNKSFIKMMDEMRSDGIAHGDLQHGNIIMVGQELRLVDYDGMFVPSMKNFMATELGHPNYQHPNRADCHFGSYLDNFSAWVIYASIRALQIDPMLLNQLGGGDDCLLFRKSDFTEPLQSAAFAALEKHKNEELQMLGRFIRAQLAKDLIHVPHLQLPLPGISANKMAPIAEHVSTIKAGPRIERSDASEWLQNENIGAILKPGVSRIDAILNNSFNQHQSSWVVPHKAPQPSAWVKPTAQQAPVKKSSVMTHASPLTPAVVIPAPLAGTATPRPVVFDKVVGLVSPWTYQTAMIFFPFVWAMLFYFNQAMTVDNDLRLYATTYDATIRNVVRYDTTSKNTVTHHTDVDSTFNANGKTFFISRDMATDYGKFKKGDIYPVRALASNPHIHEPYGTRAGTRQADDYLYAYLNLALNLIMELLIWCRPLWHKYLAEHGLPAIATITGLTAIPTQKSTTYSATVEYTVNSVRHANVVTLAIVDYHNLKKGTQEVILCDPSNVNKFVFYKFCLYKATVPPAWQPQPAPTLPHKP